MSGSFLRRPSAQPSVMTRATLQAAHRLSLLGEEIACCAKARAGGSTILVGRCSASVSSACVHRPSQREQLLLEAESRLGPCCVSAGGREGLLRKRQGRRQHHFGGQAQGQRIKRLRAQAE